MKAIVVLLLVAACARPTVAPLVLPLSVDEALPTVINRSEVNRDPDGCYFYTYAAALFVVKDRDGNPICIPT